MPLTDDELFELFADALSLYIKNNGETVDFSKFRLTHNPADGNGKVIVIRQWDYAFAKPTRAELKALALEDVKASKRNDLNIPQRITDAVSNNFTLFALAAHLRTDHGMTNAQIATFLRQQYRTFNNLD